VGVVDVGEEAGEGRAAEVVHRDHERGADRVDDAGHLVLGHRVGAVDRDHHDVDLADLAQVLAGELVVEVAEVGDAQVGGLEDEDRVAVALGAGAAVHAGGDVADAQVLQRDVVLGLAPRGAPAAQRVLPPGRRLGVCASRARCSS
jgi:hypothetical protein